MVPTSQRQTPDKCLECGHREHRIFCKLSGNALEKFSGLGVQISYPGRVTVFGEGQKSQGIYVVCTGLLKLSTTSKEGRTMILRLAGPGDVLGLSATLNNTPYEVSADTLEPCQLKSIRPEEFLEFMNATGELSRNTAQTLAREYREVFLDARRLALSGSAGGRLAQLLLEWAHATNRGQLEMRFTMALTHGELASLAGTSRETVTRLLNKFERDHWIKRLGATIVITRPQELEKLAD
jgi:CRP/FNR family transcriptional regulator